MAPGSEQTIHDQRFFTILVSALIALAWLVLWVWGQSPYGRFLSHEHLGEVSLDDSTLILIFVVGWSLMTVAMMLPTTFPLLGLFHAMIADRRHSASLIGLCITGYLIAWVSFGILAYFGMLWLQPLASASNF